MIVAAVRGRDHEPLELNNGWSVPINANLAIQLNSTDT